MSSLIQDSWFVTANISTKIMYLDIVYPGGNIGLLWVAARMKYQFTFPRHSYIYSEEIPIEFSRGISHNFLTQEFP